MNPWITSLVIPLILLIASSLMGYIVWLLQTQRKENIEARKITSNELSAIKDGLKLELRRDIITDHNRYVIDKEQMLPLAYENLCEVYDAYITLGGNGMAEKLKKEIDEVHFKRGGIK